MDFGTWIEVNRSKGIQQVMEMQRLVEKIYSLTSGEELAKWTYVKRPNTAEAEFYLYDGRRIHRFCADGSYKFRVEIWEKNWFTKIVYESDIVDEPDRCEVHSLELTGLSESLKFNSMEDIPSKNRHGFRGWAQRYNEQIDLLYAELRN